MPERGTLARPDSSSHEHLAGLIGTGTNGVKSGVGPGVTKSTRLDFQCILMWFVSREVDIFSQMGPFVQPGHSRMLLAVRRGIAGGVSL